MGEHRLIEGSGGQKHRAALEQLIREEGEEEVLLRLAEAQEEAEATKQSFAAYEHMLSVYGAQELERRAAKLDSYRRYYRKWPFEGRKTVIDIEEVTGLATVGPDPMETIIAAEAAEELLASMSGRQAEVVEMVAQGYRLHEIAELLGHDNSGKVRWFYYTVKREMGVPIQASKRRHRHLTDLTASEQESGEEPRGGQDGEEQP